MLLGLRQVAGEDVTPVGVVPDSFAREPMLLDRFAAFVGDGVADSPLLGVGSELARIGERKWLGKKGLTHLAGWSRV